MIMLLRRLIHAYYLTFATSLWIWKRFLGIGYNFQRAINFTSCYHCGEHYTRNGLVYCPGCIKVLAQEYAQDAQTLIIRQNAICEKCEGEAAALYCLECGIYVCTHLSLWANDDALGPNGEQLVHRCNECEGELMQLQAQEV